ncbi:protein of unknown function [Candidatus Promineifilum breve]|uniref:Uncharacterized protein n=1 Tax=Candidatus Promineifilum breve TaxID=1806508 RepID=A0A160TAB5_9CHLR|nr:protein of unknown function [Candidatus Promineifilum breve]
MTRINTVAFGFHCGEQVLSEFNPWQPLNPNQSVISSLMMKLSLNYKGNRRRAKWESRLLQIYIMI